MTRAGPAVGREAGVRGGRSVGVLEDGWSRALGAHLAGRVHVLPRARAAPELARAEPAPWAPDPRALPCQEGLFRPVLTMVASATCSAEPFQKPFEWCLLPSFSIHE